MNNKKIPVTLLSGFLGSGKTTLLKHVLQNREGYKVAVIVNDMAELNIDAELIKNEVQLSQTEEKMIEISNGCICCTLREDLLIEVKKLCEYGKYDALIIESSGISEPTPVAQTFSYQDEDTGISLSDYCTLDTLVTVIDASTFYDMYMSSESLKNRDMELGEDDTRTLSQLLTEQVECCDVLILNKTDLINDDLLHKTKVLLKSLQPEAKIIETSQGNVPFNQIINTGLFDMDKSSQSAGWMKELELGHKNHTPETQEYGISSFIYRKELPFHPEKFEILIHNDRPDGLFRVKGLVRLANRPDSVVMVNQTGGSLAIEVGPRRSATLLPQERIEMGLEEEYKQFEDKLHGDRITELVIIGKDIDQEHITSLFDSVLVLDYDHNKALTTNRGSNSFELE